MNNLSKIIFAYYLFFLFWGILFKFNIQDTLNIAQNFPTRSLNLSPFSASGGRLEVIFNVLIFIPFGFFSIYLSKNRSFLGKLWMIFTVSFLVEILQYFLGIGASDVTDLITNTFGGLIGIVIYQITQKSKNAQSLVHLLFAFFLAFFTFLILSH